MKNIFLAMILLSATSQVSGLEYADASSLEKPREFWDRMDREWAERQKADRERRVLENKIRERRRRDLERNYDLMYPNNTWNPHRGSGRRPYD
jgi:hypothetical protein